MTPSTLPLLQKHMPELDVLRGTAILAVLLYHGFYWSGAVSTNFLVSAFFKSTVFGWLGVNLFFVLSGFLITGILLDTRGSGSFYRRFYYRRALRILPAYLAIIVVLALLGWMTVRSTVVYLLFLANYSTVLHVYSYGPLWSLSVEEQFYLIWPALVGWFSTRALAVVSATLCFGEPLLRWMTASGRVHAGDVHSATYLMVDNLAMGALAAIFARSRYGSVGNGKKFGAALCVAGGAVFLLGYPFGILHRTNVFGAALQTVPWNLIFTGVLLLSLGLKSDLASSVWTAPLRFLGYISYGLYLIHVLIFAEYGTFTSRVTNLPVQHFLQGWFVRFFMAGGISIAIAWFSRKFYEESFLHPARTKQAVAVPQWAQSGVLDRS